MPPRAIGFARSTTACTKVPYRRFKDGPDSSSALPPATAVAMKVARSWSELHPPHAGLRIEQYVPFDELFPACDALGVSCRWGTTMAALAHGVPMVLVPIAADQPDIASRCDEAGVSRTVAPPTSDPAPSPPPSPLCSTRTRIASTPSESAARFSTCRHRSASPATSKPSSLSTTAFGDPHISKDRAPPTTSTRLSWFEARR